MANFGGDSLHQLKMQRLLESAIQNRTSGGRNNIGGGGQSRSGLMTAGQGIMGSMSNPMVSSASMPTAAEQGAFNDRKKNRALYGKYGKGGLMRDTLDAETALKREGFANEKAIAAARNKTDLGLEGLKNAGLLGVASKDLEGAKYGADLEAKTRNRTSDMQFGLKSPAMVRATKPQYHYAENKDQLGDTVGYTAYRDGQPMPGPPPGELDWAKTVNEGQFEQAGEVVKRMMANKKPEELDSFIDDIFRTNPPLGEYLRENYKPPQNQSKPNGLRSAKNNTVGNSLIKGPQMMGDQFMQNLAAPYRWGKNLLNTEMPGWLR